MMQAMDKRLFAFLALGAAFASPLAAQQVRPCGDGGDFAYETTAMAIAEPWEANMRSFANGDIRITIMDIWEPALGAYYLMVLNWPAGDIAAERRECSLVSNGELGFVGMTLEGLKSRYDPARGLVLDLPTSFYNPVEDDLEEGVLQVVIDRKNQVISANRP